MLVSAGQPPVCPCSSRNTAQTIDSTTSACARVSWEQLLIETGFAIPPQVSKNVVIFRHAPVAFSDSVVFCERRGHARALGCNFVLLVLACHDATPIPHYHPS